MHKSLFVWKEFAIMRHEKLVEWLLERVQPVDKTTMLLEHYLLLRHMQCQGEIVATRKEIADFTGWSYKTVNKAIDALNETGYWKVDDEEHTRIITFVALFNDQEDEPKISKSELTELIWDNSSLSGTSLEVALACAHLYKEGKVEASLREISALVGRSVNTVRECIEEMVRSGEWEKEMSDYRTILTPDLAVLTECRSQERSQASRSKTGGVLVPSTRDVSSNEDLPYFILDLGSMHKENIAPFKPRRSYKSYADRLIEKSHEFDRPDARFFTQSRITELYEKLTAISNIETVDTLLTYQLLMERGIALKFLRHVLSRINKRGLTAPPVKYNHEDESSPGYQTALAVWSIIKARKSPKKQ